MTATSPVRRRHRGTRRPQRLRAQAVHHRETGSSGAPARTSTSRVPSRSLSKGRTSASGARWRARVPAAVSERVTVSSTNAAGYALTVHRSAFQPADLPLGMTATAPSGGQIGPQLAAGRRPRSRSRPHPICSSARLQPAAVRVGTLGRPTSASSRRSRRASGALHGDRHLHGGRPMIVGRPARRRSGCPASARARFGRRERGTAAGGAHRLSGASRTRGIGADAIRVTNSGRSRVDPRRPPGRVRARSARSSESRRTGRRRPLGRRLACIPSANPRDRPGTSRTVRSPREFRRTRSPETTMRSSSSRRGGGSGRAFPSACAWASWSSSVPGAGRPPARARRHGREEGEARPFPRARGDEPRQRHGVVRPRKHRRLRRARRTQDREAHRRGAVTQTRDARPPPVSGPPPTHRPGGRAGRSRVGRGPHPAGVPPAPVSFSWRAPRRTPRRPRGSHSRSSRARPP